MREKEIFSRSKETKVCDTPELVCLITEWTQKGNWKFEDFWTFLELVGINNPIRLYGLYESKHSFEVLTEFNEEITVVLVFDTSRESTIGIWLKDGNQEKQFVTNSNIEDGTVPSVILRRKNIVKDGMMLRNFYCEYFCNRILEIDSEHKLKIYVCEPEEADDKDNLVVLRNSSQIEEYLLGLDNSFAIEEVFNTVLKFLELSEKEMRTCDGLKISYCEGVGMNEQMCSCISIENGELKEYATFQNGEKFDVFRNGNWKFNSDTVKIDYSKENYEVSLSGEKHNVENMKVSDILERVEKEVHEIMRKFNK